MSTEVVHVEVTADAPADTVFDLLADADGWSSWAPFARSELEQAAPGDDPRGVGAVRRFRAPFRRTFTRERVVGYEPPRRFAYTLLSGLPLEDYLAEVTLTPGERGTAITWHSTFRPRIRGTGWFYRWLLQRFIAALARRLAATAETAYRTVS